MSRADVFDPTGHHMAVLMPDAVARVTAALSAIGVLSGLLSKMTDEADFEDDAPEVESQTTRGILNAIAVCATFTHDHINSCGLTSHHTLALEADEAGFDQLTQLTRQAKDLQTTARDKRRMAIVEGQSC